MTPNGVIFLFFLSFVHRDTVLNAELCSLQHIGKAPTSNSWSLHEQGMGVQVQEKTNGL